MRKVGVSERRACDQSAIGRGTYRYQGKGAADEPMVRGLIRELARLRPRFGSPRLSALVRRELGPVNHKRVERIMPRKGCSRPGKPTDNAFIEAFNGRFRQECLNENWFLSLEDAAEKVESWRKHYNGETLLSALGNLSPREFAALATTGD